IEGGTSPALVARAALAYSRRGIPVFPCEPGGKRPLTYNGFWDATTDAPRLSAWWRRWPDANVGVPTGEQSGLLVLDVDSDAGGPDGLALLERLYGPLPRTAKARTGGGGLHVFFRYPAGELVRNSAGKLGPGLDVRGEGGYVVVPGIGTIDASGASGHPLSRRASVARPSPGHRLPATDTLHATSRSFRGPCAPASSRCPS